MLEAIEKVCASVREARVEDLNALRFALRDVHAGDTTSSQRKVLNAFIRLVKREAKARA